MSYSCVCEGNAIVSCGCGVGAIDERAFALQLKDNSRTM